MDEDGHMDGWIDDDVNKLINFFFPVVTWWTYFIKVFSRSKAKRYGIKSGNVVAPLRRKKRGKEKKRGSNMSLVGDVYCHYKIIELFRRKERAKSWSEMGTYVKGFGLLYSIMILNTKSLAFLLVVKPDKAKIVFLFLSKYAIFSSPFAPPLSHPWSLTY